MSHDPRIERVMKLVRLALHNPNEEEARSAALKALTLMNEHRMVLSLPQTPPTPSMRAPTPEWMNTMRQQQEAMDRARREQERRYREAAQSSDWWLKF